MHSVCALLQRSHRGWWAGSPTCDNFGVAGLSPVHGFHTAAVAGAVTFMSTLSLVLTSHREPAMKVKDRKEVVAVAAKGYVSMVSRALLQSLAAVAAGVAGAAVLG